MKKIMFNDKFGLTRAVLDGRKTMTRRCVPNKIVDEWWDYLNTCAICHAAPLHVIKHATYQVGEVVAIAQSYEKLYDAASPESIKHYLPALEGWDNKMYVKAELMRHHIRITNIKVERLQDISNEDCLREGISQAFNNVYSFIIEGKKRHVMLYETPKDAFSILIDKVSGKGTWERNPYVFVYEFELVD